MTSSQNLLYQGKKLGLVIKPYLKYNNTVPLA